MEFVSYTGGKFDNAHPGSFTEPQLIQRTVEIMDLFLTFCKLQVDKAPSVSLLSSNYFRPQIIPFPPDPVRAEPFSLHLRGFLAQAAKSLLAFADESLLVMPNLASRILNSLFPLLSHQQAQFENNLDYV